MKLEKASKEAVRFAILKWHYSKAVPMVQSAYAVFNDSNEFCGVICYSIGANKNIASPFGLVQGQAAELVRVALNGKQGQTSRALGISLRLIKKDNPLLKVIVSYADEEQNHHGGIYQATNWLFLGDSVGSVPLLNGKRVHKRTFSSVHGSYSGVKMQKTKPKHKYVYFFDQALKAEWQQKSLPYPKKSGVDGVCSNTPAFQAEEDVQVDLNAPLNQKEAKHGRAS